MTKQTDLATAALDAATRGRIHAELDKNFMVEAAAGTGKTTCIVDRMVRLIAENQCQIEQLVAVTFTRKAAAELRERFQAELRRHATQLQSGTSAQARATYLRLQSASDNASRAFVGTIHSFCASLLRERPVEFGVDPVFRELDEEEDQQLREQAWQDNIADLFASGDPLIDQIDDYGIDRKDLRSCFDRFIEYRDVEQWQSVEPAEFDLDDVQSRTREYIEQMRQLLPSFPVERGDDKLMTRYEEIVRSCGKDWSRLGNFFAILEKFDRTSKVVQYRWGQDRKSVAKQEQERWQNFRQTIVAPAMDWWRRKRYRFVVEFVRRAVHLYEQQKAAGGGIDFTDLLLRAARGLKSQPQLREYFQQRYSHLLVDEFQDTDPIQAEMLLYLVSENVHQQEWHRCDPRGGSLFLVGDPKQSIYRFRRGDIVTYNRVKEVFQRSGGEVLSLVKNFRCRTELIRWNNRIFSEKFPQRASPYKPAAEEMVQGREDACEGVLAGIRKLTIPVQRNIADTTSQEAELIASYIRQAIDGKLTVPRTSRELKLGCKSAVQPRDFLVITRTKKQIDRFKNALDRHNVACQVTGGNALSGISHLSVLIECLRAVDDPNHAVHYLAVLRDRLFAFDDEELFEFKRAGGRFRFTAHVPEQLAPQLRERFEHVNARLRRYQSWLRTHPFAVAVSRIASDLGLLAGAAADREGNIALGGFLKAIELLRGQSGNFDSAADIIGYLERLETVDETEGCTALPPESNVVRVMNLHKAKGLESPIVFLADTSMPYRGQPVCHIDRSGDKPVGYMGITKKYGKYQTQEVATPENWDHWQAEERQFLQAERDRLLYVATTRAASMLVVSVGSDKSNWEGLHSYLTDACELELPTDQQLAGVAAPRQKSTATVSVPPERIAANWTLAREHSYEIQSAKELSLKGQTRPDWEASGDYGYKWGSAIHELLEIAGKTPRLPLQGSALRLARQYDLAAERVEELLATVECVRDSDIWKRAQSAMQCFSELPLETLSMNEHGRPVITRGVIDLIFEESGGWVIVDYKTDDLTISDIKSAVDFYRRQVQQYARHWTDSTGYQVAERGLYFTRVNSYVVCPA